jgi:hypothetical protein
MADRRPADDPTIPNDEQLFIRVFVSPDVLKPVGDGQYRPISGGITGRNKDEPLSVDLGSLCTKEQTRDRGINGPFHVVMVTAAAVRACGLRIRREPIQGAVPNAAHAIVIGKRENPSDGDQTGGLTKGEYAKVAYAARVVINTPQPA